MSNHDPALCSGWTGFGGARTAGAPAQRAGVRDVLPEVLAHRREHRERLLRDLLFVVRLPAAEQPLDLLGRGVIRGAVAPDRDGAVLMIVLIIEVNFDRSREVR